MADLGETVRPSEARYEGGTSTYLEVLDAQRSLYSAELTLAEARAAMNIAVLSSCIKRLAEAGSNISPEKTTA